MSQKVIVMAGSMQSGKSTSAKYVVGTMLKRAGIFQGFEVHDESGDLFVATRDGDKNAIVKLDLYDRSWEFTQWAAQNVWEHCKIYSFATQLKQTAINMFGLNEQNIYGDNAAKSQPTHIKWKDIWPLLNNERRTAIATQYNFSVFDEPPNDLYCTHREFLQDLGTILRTMDNDCHVESCWAKIWAEDYPYAIIDDGRYENEFTLSHKYGAKIVKLTHEPFTSSHASEQLHKIDKKHFDYVIDNKGKSIRFKEEELLKILIKEGWIKISI